ncbi:tripartite tricarboxylate transporter substrate binding protein [Ramlibacter sp. AW1]|uniref:Tripartite tricarboxylate transporter substrate binding protein n=1 Tax=Ramlibacter aurantiacus TaxID=2801330 RepID=A0A936ZMV9_9BURK|nr:tripartite tricarboxylate transporter substrate binding protein [Ramlibacter aurantiacus]MBL0422672.1 tripartite tricarboxylate transporter substrate binding protein [Ramlibacter aurantiacus]
MNKRQFLRLPLLSAIAWACVAGTASAQPSAYPGKPITIIVPFAAGGSTDTMARLIGKKLSAHLNQPVIVENRPGAGSTIGSAIVAKAPPDGHTLLVSTISLAINASLQPNVPFDAVKDLQPVTQISSLPLVLVVNSSLPARNLREFVELARNRPVKLNYASSGNGTSPHLAGEMFKTMAKVDMVHVPYKGNAPVMNDLLAGHVDAHFGLLPAMLPQVKNGKLRALAVTTEKRTPALPDVPTLAESGFPDYEINSWQGLFAPAQTPPEVVRRLSEVMNRIIDEPEFRTSLSKEGSDPVGGSSEQFTRHVENEVRKWARVVKESGAKPD